MRRAGSSPARAVAAALALCALVWAAGPAPAQQAGSGRVVEVSRDVRLERGGAVDRVAVGTPVAVGDILRSGAGARAQIEFSEGTRIALGPDSVLRIDEILLRRNGTARKFAVSAVGGAFRFLSGESPDRAYTIRTPSATMGIRGTAFDIAVSGREATDLLVFEGRVLFCGAGRNCIRVPGGCNLLTVDDDSVFGEPESLAAKLDRIAAAFPFARDQTALLPPFQAATRGCGEQNAFRLGAAAAPRTAPDRAAVDIARPGRAPDPSPGREPDPEPGPGPAPDPEPPDFNPAE